MISNPTKKNSKKAIGVAILGSRGIPNQYGGFEQFAEKLSVGLAETGMQVWVYCSHTNPCKDTIWKGVHRIRCFDPEPWLGQAGQFIYDLNCILDARHRNFDIIYQLGYTSSSVWHGLLPRHPKIITNMDGLEWQRSKYSKPVQGFLKKAEQWAVKSSHLLVADSPAIRDYIAGKYNKVPEYIAYGADIPDLPNKTLLSPLGLLPGAYYLVIARIQPDNNLDMIIQGFLKAKTEHPLVVVGNIQDAYARKLVQTYASDSIRFAGGIYDKPLLDALRHYCRMYFHGHSAGGTNPSLLEAMAASAPVCAHDNLFNRAVLQQDALFFKQAADIAGRLNQNDAGFLKLLKNYAEKNRAKINDTFSWEKIVDAYVNLFKWILKK